MDDVIGADVGVIVGALSILVEQCESSSTDGNTADDCA